MRLRNTTGPMAHKKIASFQFTDRNVENQILTGKVPILVLYWRVQKDIHADTYTGLIWLPFLQ